MSDVTDIIKHFLRGKKVTIDNALFRLHYKITVIVLMLFSFLVSSKQYFGDPITCDSGGKIDNNYIDTYCWIYSTFTIKKHLQGVPGREVIAPGVGSASKSFRVSDNTDEIVRHKYYQWVFLVLLVQAFFFYLPRYIWKVWEGGRISLLVENNDLNSPLIGGTVDNNIKESITKYFFNNQHVHNIYALRYITCEIYNLVNVIGQIFIFDWFLCGRPTGFSIAVTTFANLTEIDSLTHVFPKIAKCTYENFGPSGTIQIIDATCVLPLNVVNEKLYVILWFWFVILSIISLLGLIYRIVTFSSKTIRSYLLTALTRSLDKRSADTIVRCFTWGDWFVLNQLSKNMDPIKLEELLLHLETKCRFKKLGHKL